MIKKRKLTWAVISLVAIFCVECALTKPLVADSTVDRKFPWILFLPAITSVHECSSQYLGRCLDRESCGAAGGYWWSKKCNKTMSVNQAYMTRLTGYLTFHYLLYGVEWTEHYYFDMNTLQETSSESGYFNISGVDDYGHTVIAKEYALGSAYFFINDSFPSLEERFLFWIDDNGNVSGTFKVRPKGAYSDQDVRADLYGKHSTTSFPK